MSTPRDRIATICRKSAQGMMALVTLLAAAWTVGALVFDGPGAPCGALNWVLAALWAAGTVVAALKLRVIPGIALRILACCFVVWLGWLTIRPSNDREWKPEFEMTGYVTMDGNQLTFHHVRNFDYTESGDALPHWETRKHHLDQLIGADIIIDAFGGDLMAHPIISFDFGEEGRLALSIETRREVGESYSAIGGLYKMFELQYIFGDEADFVRVRTNVRDEPCYIYRFNAPAERARELLLDCINAQNHLKEHPQWYNAITANCTTSYRAQTPAEQRASFDLRILINGKLDQMLYERGALVTGDLPFAALREQAFINKDAQAHPRADGFSDAIRRGRVGFTKPPLDAPAAPPSR
ncbi:DUF4105 domain-containing protein [Sulfuriroseicoccus oceanibius]|uniref:DUF4105 domain-containing protein n=1 Tax=Sulfuriroseicoccus oceanibius TaxID=2707525 RepID=A0A6B3L2K3_9BACT|nr:DUF4105 domain-containing protein [Sulfuriroseicoccus oceanibius]QQL46074.1 DUF4105 domain-containing protein [Sulfuriroseicoccus oceanibius]